jgi:hypothetical protein
MKRYVPICDSGQRLRMGEDKIDPSKVKKVNYQVSDLVGVPNGVPA